MFLGENMMLIRKKKGPSQAELERMIGTSGDVVGRYERGDITPSIEVVSKISDALEGSINYLIGKIKMELETETGAQAPRRYFSTARGKQKDSSSTCSIWY